MYQSSIQPTFNAGSAGKLFELRVCPQSEHHQHAMLFVAPFAEEMNKSRKMMTELLIRFALGGGEGRLFDFFGTGDSEGEFEQATWQIWVEDLKHMIGHLCQNESIEKLSIVTLRTGALLLNDTLQQMQQEDLPKLTGLHYWNPVLNPSQFISQFLRLKLAADMVKSESEKLTAKDLRAQLKELGHLEVAGYMLNNALFEGMENSQLALPSNLNVQAIHFYEISALPNVTPALSIGIKKMLGDEQDYHTHCINDAPFWSTQEIAVCESLLALTLDNLSDNKDPS